MKKLTLLTSVCALISCLWLTACDKDDKDGGKAQVAMHLTDGPGDYDAVWLDVREIEVKIGDDWNDIPLLYPGQYDILRFRNGNDTLMGTTWLPAGHLQEIRLVLGDNNSVVIDGSTYPLTTPSAHTSGYKIKIDETLDPGLSYDVWIDFDAARSIHQTGNGKYMLKPVTRAYTRLTNGRIKGVVMPPAANAVVHAIQGVDTFSAIPMLGGAYLISGLPAGTYQVWIDADAATGYQDVMIPGVTVSFGAVTDLGLNTLVQ